MFQKFASWKELGWIISRLLREKSFFNVEQFGYQEKNSFNIKKAFY